MAKIITSASMSLDGFIAGPAESGFEHLFAWHRNGDIEVPSADPRWSFQVNAASAQHLRDQLRSFGALVVGRRLYDMTRGWGGNHPFGVPVFVVTHRPPETELPPGSPFTFVTGGLQRAVELAAGVAGDRIVGVAAGDLARQALDAGLIDEVHVDLVPVILGDGVRLVGTPGTAPIALEDPIVVPSARVTHLYYRVRTG